MNLKRILITGVNSYIGRSFKTWLDMSEDSYIIDMISMRDGEWRKRDLSVYDCILHVSALVHQKERKEFENEYYKVNCENTYNLAKLAKDAGVKQFIFLSSMSIYGDEMTNITKNTVPNPSTFYGKSKLLAEQKINELRSEKFKVTTIRPPMVYGKDCPGNYFRLSKLALRIPMFPNLENKRSMIYIDNLCFFIQQILDNGVEGVFCPQNKNYVCTSDMVKEISKIHQHKLILISIFNPLLKLLKRRIAFINKIFGDLTYDVSLSKDIKFNYHIVEWEESIQQSEF